MKLTRIKNGRVHTYIYIYMYSYIRMYTYIMDNAEIHMPTRKKNWICSDDLSLRNFEKKKNINIYLSRNTWIVNHKFIKH